jgi:hypothetical protein
MNKAFKRELRAEGADSSDSTNLLIVTASVPELNKKSGLWSMQVEFSKPIDGKRRRSVKGVDAFQCMSCVFDFISGTLNADSRNWIWEGALDDHGFRSQIPSSLGGIFARTVEERVEKEIRNFVTIQESKKQLRKNCLVSNKNKGQIDCYNDSAQPARHWRAYSHL